MSDDPHLHGAASGEPPRPHARAPERAGVAAALDVAHHDHRAGDDAVVLGVDLELVPDGLDVGEVVAQALVADVGLLPTGRARAVPST